MSNRGRDSGRAAELRAEGVRWKERSRETNQASRSMDARLRQMKEQAGELDGRLRRHQEEGASWHTKWDDRSRLG